ncbi:MOSC domain-containing protein [Paenibacillus sp. MMS20-IR301]|uniref:MOSC domain-containing protein n=1 Tax=Paenibacillus sp. MMS20-IR301 TaxID=2895946 RepID=UPI0028EF7936|nr:MOSC domain-containing protein [Paenibacillus sp. MMS20-IR301]WNS42584.1 MOSC domain-containing protein [Paenibacillus sp. MMS20-IR301]
MKVVSLNVGKPKTVDYRGKPLETGIYKLSVSGPASLRREGFDGDGQADLINHGGADKAVCVYPFEHYAFWGEQLGKKLEYAAFGENLTVSGLLETEVCIGDIYEIGTALLQVSQPRFPCFKLSQKHGPADMPARVLSTGYSGFYLRVLREGEIACGDGILKRESGAGGFSVKQVLYSMEHGRRDKTGLAELAGLDSLAAVIRERFRGWLAAWES